MINFKKLFASSEVKSALWYLEVLKKENDKVSHLINRVFTIVEKSLLESWSELIKHANTKGNVKEYVDNEVRDVIKWILLNWDIFFTFQWSTYAEQGYDLIEIYDNLLENSVKYYWLTDGEANKDVSKLLNKLVKFQNNTKEQMSTSGDVTYYYDTDLDLEWFWRFWKLHTLVKKEKK